MADSIDTETTSASELSDLYAFDATTGTITPKDTSEVEGIVKSEVMNALGISDTEEIHTSTPLGRMVEWLALHFSEVLYLNVQNANQLLLSAAAGQQLDAMAQWFQLYRKRESYTTVTATVSTTVGGSVTIPAGSRARTTEGYYFTTIEEITLGNGQPESKEVIFRSVLPGAIPCASGALRYIDTPISGWVTVYNSNAGTIGSGIETDDSLRDRIRTERTTAIGFIGSIKNAIERIEGVKSSIVLENNTGKPLDNGHIKLDEHSIFVCVDGDTESIKEDIAQAIFNNKPCGTGYTRLGDSADNDNPGEYEVEVEDPYGNKYPVVFYKPSPVEITVDVTIAQRNYTGTDLDKNIRRAVMNWFGTGLGVGATVYASDILSAIESSVSGIIVMECKVTAGEPDTAIQYWEVAAYQKAVYGKTRIHRKL